MNTHFTRFAFNWRKKSGSILDYFGLGAIPLIAIVSVTCIGLSGCSAIPASSNIKGKPSYWSEFTGKVDAHGALPVMHDEFNVLPFMEMLMGKKYDTECPPTEEEIKAYYPSTQLTPSTPLTPLKSPYPPPFTARRYQCAIDHFYERTSALPDFAQRLERNRIQEHVLAISDDRCNAYKRYLRYDQSMSKFWLGVGSTLAGGLGALASTMTAAKTFAATGGVLSGISAEYSQDFYGNLFYSVVTKAIDEQRRDAYRQIQTYGQSKNLTDYPVEAALKDAIAYDGMCSAVSAMQYAEKAVQLVNDPGMDGMMRFLVKANQSRVILQNSVTNADELKKFGVSTIEDARFGSRLNSGESTNPLTTIQMQQEKANQQNAETIVDAIKPKDAGNDPEKLKAWENAKATLLSKVKAELKTVIAEFNKRLMQCSEPAVNLYGQYLSAEDALRQDNTPSNQITRNNIQSKIGQLNVQILGISQHFDFLLSDLEKAVATSVSKWEEKRAEPVLNWKYDELPDLQFKGPYCHSFEQSK